MTPKEHFSGHSAEYRRYRPGYPPELAAFLARSAPGTSVALDVASGNGQAVLDLACHFERVLASDASRNQLSERTPHPRVLYLRHAAEQLPGRGGAADLVTVAQAAHRLDLPRCYAEARRVLRPCGVVALWAYSLFQIDTDTDADSIVDGFYRERVGCYWPQERRHVDAHHLSLPLPLEELPAPSLNFTVEWPLAALINYVGTWSAVERCRAATGVDPLPELAAALEPHWPLGGRREIRFPIHLRIGRV